MVQASSAAPPHQDFDLFSPEMGGTCPGLAALRAQCHTGRSPWSARQVSLHLRPWDKGAMLSHCVAREVTVCDSGGAATTMFHSCLVLLPYLVLQGNLWQSVRAFESLRASEQQR